HAGDLEEARHPSRDEPALTSGDPGDEQLLAGLGTAVRTRGLGRRGRLREVEELLRSLEGEARHRRTILVRRRAGQQPVGGNLMMWLLRLLLVVAVATPASSLHLAAARLVDLTHAFDAATIYWPPPKPFSLEPVAHGVTPGGWWYAANNFCAAEHGGTHLDAPIHFAAD